MARSLCRGSTGLGSAILLLCSLCLGACLPEALPGWMITNPRLLVIEQTVVEAGPHSQPLELDPEGVVRREGLPGDKVRLEAFIAGPDGPVEPTGPPLWIRSSALFYGIPYGELPPCAEDGLDGELFCRVEGDTLTLPPMPADEGGTLLRHAFLLFASTSEEIDAEGCLAGFQGLLEDDLFGCHSAQMNLEYGPKYRLEELAEIEVVSVELEPDYALRTARLELTIHGEGGAREVLASSGDTVLLRPEESMDLRLGVADESELQVLGVQAMEFVRGQFWATAPVLQDLAEFYLGNLDGIRGHPDPFYLYVDVIEASRTYGAGIGDFMWVRFVPDDAGVPSP